MTMRKLGQIAARGLMRAAGLSLIAIWYGVVSPPSAAQEQQPRLVGSIHGYVVADVPSASGRGSISIPNARVTVAEATRPAPENETFTALTGRFSTPLQPPGSYRVCAKAEGFAESCSLPVQITTDSVALSQLLALKPQDGVLYGHISLRDGTPAVRLAVAEGTTAGAAQVSLADGAGRVIAGPVSVNVGGEYVLAPVAAASNLILSVHYEDAVASQTVTLSEADLSTGKPVNVTLPSAVPKVTSISMTQDGKPVTSAAPGSTVVLTVHVEDGDPLHYSWTSNTTGLVAEDAPSVTMTLPNAPVGVFVFLEVTNGKGGVARGSVAVPLTSASALERGLEFKPINLSTPQNIAFDFSCLFKYCEPKHNGPFIDPLLEMNQACDSEQNCEKEAGLYYRTIGAFDGNGKPTQTGTFKGWKAVYGFGIDPNSPTNGEVRAIYYNNADLGFGRDMHCRSSGFALFTTTVACYVSNYGDGSTKTSGFDPQTAISRAADNIGRLATVAMVYNFCPFFNLCPPASQQVYRVSFYVFGNKQKDNPNDPNDGDLATTAALDNDGPKAVPGLCLDCHGGHYDLAPQKQNTIHNASKAQFLPFDAPSFIFSDSAPILMNGFQRDAIRQLNSMVKSIAYARPTISQLIDGWYNWCGGVDKTGCYIDDVGHPFYPDQPCDPNNPDLTSDSCGWPKTWGGANAQSFYQHVPRVYCRTCHVAQADHFNMESFEDWKKKNSLGNIHYYVFHSEDKSNPPSTNLMPLAERPYHAFWLDFDAQSALQAFIQANGP
jgi:hypothetical protein